MRIGNAQVWGGRNVPSQMPGPASRLYAQNVVNLLTLMTATVRTPPRTEGGTFAPDFDDEIVAGARASSHDGAIRARADPRPRSSEARAVLDQERSERRVVWLTIFVLSVFVGIEVISKVSSTLHTPLMSGANAIHGVILLGAIIVTGSTDNDRRPRRRAGRDRARRGQHGRRLRGHRPDAADVRAQEAGAEDDAEPAEAGEVTVPVLGRSWSTWPAPSASSSR